ncbi:MAG TPA: ABC transporter permease [Vicinamibacterales bacterium]|jgi:predicted permease|nr:ABC transporter permease [Vicinamibacterales bacterium]
MQTFARDVRYALRQLRRAPGFTLTALLTLSIGIGANTAIFTLTHAVLLKSLPVSNPGQLYKFGDRYNCCVQGSFQTSWSMFSYPFYVFMRDQTDAFEEVAASQTNRPALSVRRAGASTPAEPFLGEMVSGNYFVTLGVRAFAGRTIEPGDDRPNASPIAVMSYSAWQKNGLDPSLIGAPLTMNGLSVTVVGIAPPGFFGDRVETDPADFWIPLSMEPVLFRENSLLRAPSVAWLYAIGRLRAGRNPSVVEAQLTTELRQFLLTPGNTSAHQDLKKVDQQQIRLTPGGSGINALKDEYEQGLLLLMAVSAVVLIIACANLANLLLARGAATRLRTSLQLAIGASRARILRSQLTESMVLSLLGGAAGLLLAHYTSRALLLMAFRGSANVPISTAPSVPILLFTLGVSVATGVVFGVWPAWSAARADPIEALRGSGRVTRDASALPQRALIVVQAALSVVLLTVAGLTAQSLRNLENQPYGFDPRGRLVLTVNPLSAGYTQDRLTGLYQELEDRLARTPGVISETLCLYTAQQGNNWGEEVFFTGKTGDFGSSWDRVSARYFETIGTPIVRGRGFGDEDTALSQKVAVVNEAFARKYFPNEDPVGQHFGKDEASHAGDYLIVGVAKDAKYQDASNVAGSMFFVPLKQKIHYDTVVDNRVEDASMYMGTIVLRVNGDPQAAVQEVRRTLAEVDPNLAPTSIRSLEEQLRIQQSERTLIARLSNAFGLVALLLASIGLYGVTAYRVARRTGEVGLRMALGASRTDVVALILRGSFSQIAIGLLIGIPLAVLARFWLQHQLFGISAFDPFSFATAIIALASCAFVASVLPAIRAAAVQPMQALRTE